MALDLNKFFEDHKKSETRYRSVIDLFEKKFTNVKGEMETVVLMNSLKVVKHAKGFTSEFKKYQKVGCLGTDFDKMVMQNNHSEPAKIMPDNSAITVDSLETASLNVPSHMKICVASYLEENTVEPSDADTLSSTSSVMYETITSDYECTMPESEDSSSFDEDLAMKDNSVDAVKQNQDESSGDENADQANENYATLIPNKTAFNKQSLHKDVMDETFVIQRHSPSHNSWKFSGTIGLHDHHKEKLNTSDHHSSVLSQDSDSSFNDSNYFESKFCSFTLESKSVSKSPHRNKSNPDSTSKSKLLHQNNFDNLNKFRSDETFQQKPSEQCNQNEQFIVHDKELCFERISNHILEQTTSNRTSCGEPVQLLSPKCNFKVEERSVSYPQGHIFLSAAKILKHNSPNKSDCNDSRFERRSNCALQQTTSNRMSCGGNGQVQLLSPKCSNKVEDRSIPYPQGRLLSSAAKISQHNSPNKGNFNESCFERSSHMLEQTMSCFEQVQLLSPKCNLKVEERSVPYPQGRLFSSAAKILEHNSPNESNRNDSHFERGSNGMLQQTTSNRMSCGRQVQQFSPKCYLEVEERSVLCPQGHLLSSAAKISQHNSPNKSNFYPLKFEKVSLNFENDASTLQRPNAQLPQETNFKCKVFNSKGYTGLMNSPQQDRGGNLDKFTMYLKNEAETLSSRTYYKSVNDDVLTKLCATRTLDTDNSNTKASIDQGIKELTAANLLAFNNIMSEKSMFLNGSARQAQDQIDEKNMMVLQWQKSVSHQFNDDYYKKLLGRQPGDVYDTSKYKPYITSEIFDIDSLSCGSGELLNYSRQSRHSENEIKLIEQNKANVSPQKLKQSQSCLLIRGSSCYRNEQESLNDTTCESHKNNNSEYTRVIKKGKRYINSAGALKTLSKEQMADIMKHFKECCQTIIIAPATTVTSKRPLVEDSKISSVCHSYFLPQPKKSRIVHLDSTVPKPYEPFS